VAVGLQRLEHPRLLQRGELGEDRAFFDLRLRVASSMRSMSWPSSGWPGSRPTSRQTLQVTTGLSPVSTFTARPCHAARNGRAGRFLGRVEEGQEALDHQIALIAV
jgi:hypothetical protein